MNRLSGPVAVVLALLLLGAVPFAASGTATAVDLPVADGSPAERVDDPGSSLCLQDQDQEPSFEAGRPVQASHHQEEGREIQCNVECDSFGDDCSHICGEGAGLCLPLALASGLCFFCQC